MKSTDIYIVIPEWAIWLFCIMLFLIFINNILEIYIIRLKKKIRELESI